MENHHAGTLHSIPRRAGWRELAIRLSSNQVSLSIDRAELARASVRSIRAPRLNLQIVDSENVETWLDDLRVEMVPEPGARQTVLDPARWVLHQMNGDLWAGDLQALKDGTVVLAVTPRSVIPFTDVGSARESWVALRAPIVEPEPWSWRGDELGWLRLEDGTRIRAAFSRDERNEATEQGGRWSHPLWSESFALPDSADWEPVPVAERIELGRVPFHLGIRRQMEFLHPEPDGTRWSMDLDWREYEGPWELCVRVVGVAQFPEEPALWPDWRTEIRLDGEFVGVLRAGLEEQRFPLPRVGTAIPVRRLTMDQPARGCWDEVEIRHVALERLVP